jgi:hypothetical protein
MVTSETAAAVLESEEAMEQLPDHGNTTRRQRRQPLLPNVGYGVGFDLEYDEADLLNLTSLQGGESRSGQLTGTKALMLAVLEDGIRSYLGRAKLIAAEAAYWIESNHRRSPFSFVVICETLGLDPGAVRTAVKRMKSTDVRPRQAMPRSLNNVRIPGRVCLRKSARVRKTSRRRSA